MNDGCRKIEKALQQVATRNLTNSAGSDAQNSANAAEIAVQLNCSHANPCNTRCTVDEDTWANNTHISCRDLCGTTTRNEDTQEDHVVVSSGCSCGWHG